MRRVPLPLRVTSPKAACTVKNAPVRLTPIIRCQCSAEIFAAGALSAAPALATTMSIGPWAACAAATIVPQSAAFVTSAVTAIDFGKSRATASSGAFRRPTSVTAAPSFASARAIAAPMPVPPPVTNACKPSSAPITPSPSSHQDATSIDAADRGPANKVSARPDPRNQGPPRRAVSSTGWQGAAAQGRRGRPALPSGSN